MQRNILKHLQKLFTTNYDKTIWLLIPPRRISTKPGEASLKSAGPPSILPDQQKKRVAYENSRPASSTGVLPTNVHLQERPTVHRTASMANLEKKKTRWHQERPADPNQPTNQNDFGLKGFGKNRDKTLQTSKEKYRRWKERHYFWDEVEIMRLVPRKLLNSLLLTQEVSFLFEKKVHQAILIHGSKPNWIHQSNFREEAFPTKPPLTMGPNLSSLYFNNFLTKKGIYLIRPWVSIKTTQEHWNTHPQYLAVSQFLGPKERELDWPPFSRPIYLSCEISKKCKPRRAVGRKFVVENIYAVKTPSGLPWFLVCWNFSSGETLLCRGCAVKVSFFWGGLGS